LKDLIDKFSSYNIFNYLLPGVLFAALGDRLTSYSLLIDDIVVGVFIYYFIGLVISRIGSLFLEPLLKWLKIVNFAPYSDFLKAASSDNKIELLSEANNMYRTLSSVFICLAVLKFIEFLERTYPSISSYTSIIFILLLALLFVFSYRKQSNYISLIISCAIQSKAVSNDQDKEET
jgi:hypothetical protein